VLLPLQMTFDSTTAMPSLPSFFQAQIPPCPLPVMRAPASPMKKDDLFKDEHSRESHKESTHTPASWSGGILQ